MEEIRKFQHAGMIEIAIYLQNRKQPATFTEISKGVNLNSETVRRVIDTFIKMGIAIETEQKEYPYRKYTELTELGRRVTSGFASSHEEFEKESLQKKAPVAKSCP